MKNVTPRELEVLRLCAAGFSNPQIAKELNISVHTVKAHISNILEKLDAPSRSSAAVVGVKSGLI